MYNPVWQIISVSGDAIDSPVIHGIVPDECDETITIEKVLSHGLQYHIAVFRSDGTHGGKDFQY